MSASQRLKGQRGERELFGELSERLGVVVRRNIGQTRGGGPDGLDIPGWAVECKFQDKVFAPAWWNQTLRQAEDTGRRPILFYRKTGNRTWKARLRVDDLCLYRFGVMGDMETAEVSLDVAAGVIRETLTKETP
jgi:hypothetical protein